MARKANAKSIRQLKLRRKVLRGKLDEINDQFANAQGTNFEGNVTFAMAQRNFIQGNLERVERQLLLARVSSSAVVHHDTVNIGNIVYVQRGSDIRKITVIPPTGADPDVEYVSADSQLGKALRGKSTGDMVEISTSLGKQNYGIVRIA